MARDFWRKKSRNSKVWYTRIQLPDGRRVVRSTGCTDLAAAKLARRRLEQAAMADTDAAENQAQEYALGQALTDFIADRERIGRAAGTIESYETKSKHLVRLFDPHRDVNTLALTDVERYADRRLEEGASRHTVKKELVTLIGALRVAKRRRLFRGDLDALKLEGFSAGYKPRERWLPRDEYQLLESQFQTDRARHLRFFVLTGASLGEAKRCERKDVDLRNGILVLPGTKRETRHRRLPFRELPGLAQLLDEIVATMPADRTQLFAPWSNIRRDIADACERVGIARVSPNDLRRTFGSWLKNRGLDSAVIARLMTACCGAAGAARSHARRVRSGSPSVAQKRFCVSFGCACRSRR
jgi:integrase